MPRTKRGRGIAPCFAMPDLAARFLLTVLLGLGALLVPHKYPIMPQPLVLPCTGEPIAMSRKNDMYRALLKKPACTLAANIFDPLSARIAQIVGYDLLVLSGSVGKAAN